MGFQGVAPPRPQIMAVATVAGRAEVRGRAHPKSRLWVLEDRTGVICLPSGGGKVVRETYHVQRSTWDEKAKVLHVEIANTGETITVTSKGCNCGMGAVGNAGPVAGKYDVHRVRVPEWHEVTR